MRVKESRDKALSEMTALYLERHKNRTIEVIDQFPSLHTLPRTYLGSFVWTNKYARMIRKIHAQPVGDTYWTSADMAREYLTYRYSEQKRRTTTYAYQECFCPKHKSVPMYAKPYSGDLIYVDLKAAYWNILLTGGWDVDYSPGKYIGFRSDNYDFPFPNDKMARNILVSAGLKHRVTVWTGKRLTTIAGRNKLYNGILWCFVQDVLHGIAIDMILAGALYVHTDGYILPESKLENAEKVAENWQVQIGVKYRGKGEILGPSNYWIQGKPLRKPRPTNYREHYSIFPPKNLSWLRDQYAKLEYRRSPDKWDID